MEKFRLKRRIQALLVSGFIFFSLNTAALSQSQERARIAFLPYVDATGSANYAWLQRSISDVILRQMREKFLFDAVPDKKLRPQLQGLTLKTDASTAKSEIKQETLKKIANALKCDVLIYGSYRLAKERDTILIESSLFLNEITLSRSIAVVQSKLDNTLFQATDRVAENLLAEMARMVTEAKSKKNSEKPDSVVNEPTDKKITLDKSIFLSPQKKEGVYSTDYSLGVEVGLGYTNTEINLDETYIDIAGYNIYYNTSQSDNIALSLGLDFRAWKFVFNYDLNYERLTEFETNIDSEDTATGSFLNGTLSEKGDGFSAHHRLGFGYSFFQEPGDMGYLLLMGGINIWQIRFDAKSLDAQNIQSALISADTLPEPRDFSTSTAGLFFTIRDHTTFNFGSWALLLQSAVIFQQTSIKDFEFRGSSYSSLNSNTDVHFSFMFGLGIALEQYAQSLMFRVFVEELGSGFDTNSDSALDFSEFQVRFNRIALVYNIVFDL